MNNLEESFDERAENSAIRYALSQLNQMRAGNINQERQSPLVINSRFLNWQNDFHRQQQSIHTAQSSQLDAPQYHQLTSVNNVLPETPSSNVSSVSSPAAAGSDDNISEPSQSVVQDRDIGFVARIVDVMPQYPYLWDTSKRSYRDINKKEMAWRELEEKLGAPESAIKEAWNKLRENYRRCLKKRDLKTRSGAGTSKMPTCNFYAELKFLSHSLQNKPSDSNVFEFDREPENSSIGEEQLNSTPRPKKKRNEVTGFQQPSPLDEAIIQPSIGVMKPRKERRPKTRILYFV